MSKTMPIRVPENQYRFADDLKAAGQIMADAKRRDGQSRSQPTCRLQPICGQSVAQPI
jgi:hypothetical protein